MTNKTDSVPPTSCTPQRTALTAKERSTSSPGMHRHQINGKVSPPTSRTPHISMEQGKDEVFPYIFRQDLIRKKIGHEIPKLHSQSHTETHSSHFTHPSTDNKTHYTTPTEGQDNNYPY